MSSKESTKRKRTRSEKGLAFDEMVSQTTKKERKADKAERKQVKRRIVFNEEIQQVNNNATRGIKVLDISEGNKTKGKSTKTVKVVKDANSNKRGSEKVIDPCFQNVLSKELAMEHKMKTKSCPFKQGFQCV